MRKQNGSAPGRAAEPELLKVNGQHSNLNRRRIQTLFAATRKPDLVSAGQPFWLIGVRVLAVAGVPTTRLDVFVSLCAECGAPFFFEEAAGRRGKWPNRRCEFHTRPGAAMRAFEPAWTVGKSPA